PANRAQIVIQVNQVPDIDPAGRYDFVAGEPDRIKLAVYANGGNSTVFASVLTSKTLTRVFKSIDQGATWTFVVDTPGSRDVKDGTERFVGLNPGNQADLHFAMAIDPGAPNRVYLSGDTQDALNADSPIHNTKWVGRLFALDATNRTPQADIDAGKARGE